MGCIITGFGRMPSAKFCYEHKIRFAFVDFKQWNNEEIIEKEIRLLKAAEIKYSLLCTYQWFVSPFAQAELFNKAYEKYGSEMPISISIFPAYDYAQAYRDQRFLNQIDSLFKFFEYLKIPNKNQAIIYIDRETAKNYLDHRFSRYSWFSRSITGTFEFVPGIYRLWEKPKYYFYQNYGLLDTKNEHVLLVIHDSRP